MGGIKGVAKAAVSSVISTGKELLGGIDQGVTAGRQSSQGVDGAEVLSKAEQMDGKLTLEVLRLKTSEEGVKVQLGIKNATDHPLRLIGLNEGDSVLLIDKDGYACHLLPGNPMELTIPAKAGIRQELSFETGGEPLTSLRWWGKELPLPKQ
ncbi:hypothetical protein [Pseudomonas nicosulfuronedens]